MTQVGENVNGLFNLPNLFTFDFATKKNFLISQLKGWIHYSRIGYLRNERAEQLRFKLETIEKQFRSTLSTNEILGDMQEGSPFQAANK